MWKMRGLWKHKRLLGSPSRIQIKKKKIRVIFLPNQTAMCSLVLMPPSSSPAGPYSGPHSGPSLWSSLLTSLLSSLWSSLSSSLWSSLLTSLSSSLWFLTLVLTVVLGKHPFPERGAVPVHLVTSWNTCETASLCLAVCTQSFPVLCQRNRFSRGRLTCAQTPQKSAVSGSSRDGGGACNCYMWWVRLWKAQSGLVFEWVESFWSCFKRMSVGPDLLFCYM